MATKSESDRTAERGQWTLKSRFLTTETQNAIRLAAAKAGAPIGDWRAEREEREQKLREEQAAALRASEERMGQLVSELAREGRRGRWRR